MAYTRYKSDPRAEAIARIEARFEAPTNNSIVNDRRVFAGRKEQLFSVPKPPPPTYAVGDWVALYHSPNNKAIITAMDGDTITVRYRGELVTVDVARVKPLSG